MPLAPHRVRSASLRIALLTLALTSWAQTGRATPVLGFVEHFAGTSIGTWTSGNNISNPGTGGALGASDGFLLVSTPGQNSNLGAVGLGTEYAGNYTAAGITFLTFSLNDVGADDPLEMHMSIGTMTNLWQCNTGFLPPLHAWATYSVDITSPANYTQIIGTGTFAAAVSGATLIHIRHDQAPFTQSPDPLDGDFGLDEVTLTNIPTGVPLPGAAAVRAVELATPYPNPSRGPVALSLRTFAEEPVTIEVVDVAGRVLRRTTLAATPPGPRMWTWDGLEDSGSRVAAGVYRVRAYGASSGGTSKPLIRL